ncbi:GNAT family N-acetyltransferase [Terrimonas sp. NA20]|uniref:GNAT family N-acetyltransferase n=1 Tax=Terrimonas ginsenosidimutans TaxID=2908004 RepID=A0ABS9KSV1_9BACT|nr:GNAT family N-acetyltransferase [Terrimonas ginsenosidimutans]MCG2615410.1 GNAT family N-acetyltransferase [Terrimonas ginsenosidimutans]
MLFQSDRLYTRFFTMDDLDVFYRLNGDEEVMRYIRPVKTYEECRIFLDQIIGWYDDVPRNWRVALVEKETGQVIGTFSIMPLTNTTDQHLGYALLKSYWGKGYATEVAAAGVAYVFEKLGYNSITAITDLANIPSQKVLVKCGFKPEIEYEENDRKVCRFRLIKY